MKFFVCFCQSQQTLQMFLNSHFQHICNAVDFQSKKPTNVALVGLPVNGFITWNANLCPSATRISPTSNILASRLMYGSTLSDKAFSPSLARTHLS